jgi:hypothetical protein
MKEQKKCGKPKKVVPKEFMMGTTISNPKNRTINATNSDNNRDITRCSTFGRIIDLIILDRYSDQLFSNELQFGFESGHSTSMCTMMLKETVSYYSSSNANLYCVFLDASKLLIRLNIVNSFPPRLINLFLLQ